MKKTRRSILAASLGAAATMLLAKPATALAKAAEESIAAPVAKKLPLALTKLRVDVTDEEWVIYRDGEVFSLKDGQGLWLMNGHPEDSFFLYNGGDKPPRYVDLCYDFELFCRDDADEDEDA